MDKVVYDELMGISLQFLSSEVEKQQKTLKDLRKAWRALNKSLETGKPLGKKDLVFKAKFISLWKDYGREIDTAHEGHDLEEVIRLGLEEFRKVNNRRDHQFHIHVYAVIKGVVAGEIDKKFYSGLIDK